MPIVHDPRTHRPIEEKVCFQEVQANIKNEEVFVTINKCDVEAKPLTALAFERGKNYLVRRPTDLHPVDSQESDWFKILITKESNNKKHWKQTVKRLSGEFHLDLAALA